MNIAIPIFDRLTALDAVGPYEVLSRLPGATVHFIAESTGPKRTETKMLALIADRTFDELREPDVIVVPGGYGTRALMEDETMLGWLRHAHAHAEWTTSVCTGSLLLAAAGILDGKEATCHWRALDALPRYGAIPVGDRRVVRQGTIMTAAGVSAGIDMALTLAAHIAGRGDRAGDPARDRVRPAAAVRRWLDADGAAGDRRARHPERRGAGVALRQAGALTQRSRHAGGHVTRARTGAWSDRWPRPRVSAGAAGPRPWTSTWSTS